MLIFIWSIYIVWAISVVIFCGYNVVDYKNKKFTWLSLLCIVPLLSVIVFSYVFIFNKGSSVAQLSESHNLWSVWFNWWLPLLACNALNIVVAFCSLFIRKERIKSQNTFILKSLIVFSAVLSFYHVFINMPDA